MSVATANPRSKEQDESYKESICLPILLCILCIILLLLLFIIYILTKPSFPSKLITADPEYLTVKLPIGNVVGYMLPGYKVFLFRSIPYAEAPIGENRFGQLRIVSEMEAEVWNGSAMVPRCPQQSYQEYFERAPQLISDQEDCLFLDVYVPEVVLKRWKNFANVIILLHGGEFQRHSKSDMLYDVRAFSFFTNTIIVVPNYRLNIFGFAESESPHRNLGFDDIHFAMKWTKRNIQGLQGDTDRVTIWGIDSGAVSAGALYFKLQDKDDPIQKIILQGGSPCGIGYEKQADEMEFIRTAYKLCNKTANAFQCLSSKAVYEILSATEENDGLHSPYFGPNLKYFRHLCNLDEATESGRGVTAILGFAENEGEYYLKEIMKKMRMTDFGDLTREDLRTFIERLILQFFPQNQMIRIYEYYFNSLPNGMEGASVDDIYLQASRFLGDVIVKCPMKMFADSLSKASVSVYFYEFSYAMDKLSSTKWLAATHYSDAILSTGAVFNIKNADNTDRNYSYRIISKLNNFIDKDNPTREGDRNWPKYNTNSSLSAFIQFGSLRVQPLSVLRQCQFLAMRNSSNN